MSTTLTIRIADLGGSGEGVSDLREDGDGGQDGTHAWAGLFEFVGNAPVTFAERYPLLMVGVVSVTVAVVTIAAEVEWLRAAGYYWQ